ncbi:MAG: retropepsin-like aspartic protease [Bacteroidota bacterium]
MSCQIIIHTTRKLYRVSSFYLFIAILMSSQSSALAQSEVAAMTTSDHSVDFSLEEKSDAIAVDFELISNLIWFEAEIDGEKGRFILDTGAPTLLLNDWTGEGGNTVRGEAANGAQFSLQEGRVNSFQLGGIEQGKQRVLGLDLSGMESRAGHPLHGIMGFEQLRSYELMIDYEAGRFELLTKKQKRDRIEEPVFSVPFRIVDHLPVIRLKVGQTTLHLALDSGSACNLIDQEVLDRDLEFELTGEQTRLHVLSGGENIAEFTELRDIKFRRHQLEDQVFAPVVFGESLSDDIQIDGLLGQPFFQSYRISIDYRKQKIHFWENNSLAKF